MQSRESAILQRARRQAAVTQLGRFALAGLDLGATVQEGIEAVARILDLPQVGYFEWHPQNETLVLHRAVGFDPGAIGHVSMPDRGSEILGAALESPIPLAIEDFAEESSFRPSSWFRRSGVRSVAAAAIEGRNRPFGVLCGASADPREFSPDELQFLQDVAQTLAQAIEREQYEKELAELNRTLERRVEERSRLVKVLHEVAVIANRSDTLPEALEAVLELLCRRLQWSCGQAYRRADASEDEPRAEFQYFATRRFVAEASIAPTGDSPIRDFVEASRMSAFAEGEGWVGKVAAAGRAQWVMDIADVEAIDDPRFPVALESGLKPVLAAPVALEDETIAVLELYAAQWRAPDQHLLDAMEQVGSQLAVVARRERVEEDLRLAKEHAEAAAKAKAEFLANMSHEIRTPVNAVIGMSELLLGTRLSDQQKDFFDTIRSSSSALLAVIEDILDFSKIESGALELERAPFDLRGCLEEALDIVTPKVAEKDLHLAYWVDLELPEMWIGDVTRLRQVLVNLLSNAVKFTASGEVRLDVTARAQDERMGEGGAVEGGARSDHQVYEISFSVSDTGIGIPQERQERLFVPFTQVDASTTRRYGGTGLGLVISRELCELMGGEISVESVPDVGSTFRFTINAEALSAPRPVFLQADPPMLRGKKVLLYSGHSTHREVVGRYLRHWGIEPIVAADGDEVRRRSDAGEMFDAAILDTSAAGVERVALAARMESSLRDRRSLGPLPLVMLTSLRGMRTIHSAGDRAMRYLTEPIRPERLHDILLDAIVGAADAPEIESPEPPTQADRPASQIHDAFPQGILLVEDNAVNQKVALKMLEMLGCDAVLAENGQEALDALEEASYDIVLMDLQMPVLDGLSAARTIRERWADDGPKIIAMTANAMKEDRDRCLAAGMDHYISKPVTLDGLRRALRRFIPA